jgi:hypothetical protein
MPRPDLEPNDPIRPTEPETPPRARRVHGTFVTRKDGRAMKRLTLYLPAELARRLAIHCAERDTDMSTVVTEALRAHLGER